MAGAKQQIYDKISDIIVSMDNSNLTLPPVVYDTVRAYMSPKEYEVYTKMVGDSKIFIEDALVRAVNPAVLVSKLAQIASGMVYTNKKGDYLKIHEAKIEQLQYIYDNEPSPLLVAYHYRTDVVAITGCFKDAVVLTESRRQSVHGMKKDKDAADPACECRVWPEPPGRRPYPDLVYAVVEPGRIPADKFQSIQTGAEPRGFNHSYRLQ